MKIKVLEFLKNKKGAMGIGTLIIFIAMVLVAAVAASVLINTSGFLQQKASSTGKESTEQVASGLLCSGVSGHIFKYDNKYYDLDKMVMYISPNAGSAPIDLKQAKLFLTYDGQSVVLKYGGKISATDGSQDVFNLKHDIVFNTSDYSGITATLIDNGVDSKYIVLEASDNKSIALLKSLWNGEAITKLEYNDGSSTTTATAPSVNSTGVYDADAGTYTVTITTGTASTGTASSTPLTWVYISDDDAIWGGANDKQFLVAPLQDNDGSVTSAGVINKGDIVAILVNSQAAFNAEIPERQAISGKLQPEFGAPAVVDFTTPVAYTKEVMELQ